MGKVLNFYHIGKVIPDGAEYMGRAMPHLGLKQSKFANPFRLTDSEPRGATIERYRVWLWQQIRIGKITVQDLLDLDGKDLVCFCKQPNKEVACHCDVILAAIEWAKNRGSIISYEEALKATGAEVLDFEEFGSYQGEWLALVRVNGVLGVAEGSYGSCSGCDSFEAEFGWNDREADNYQERLADFGNTYLPAWSFDELISRLEYKVEEYSWGDYEEMLEKVKAWKEAYN